MEQAPSESEAPNAALIAARSIDAATGFEMGKEELRGRDDGSSGICGGTNWRSRDGGRGRGRLRHDGSLGRAGRIGRPDALSTRGGSTRPGPPLPLTCSPTKRLP